MKKRLCFSLFLFVIGSSFAAPPTYRELTELAALINKTAGFPKMIGPNQRAERVYADSAGLLVYPYTLIDINPTAPYSEIIKVLAGDVIAKACRNKDSIYLLKRDFTLAYRYVRDNGDLIGTVPISRKNCGL